MEAIELVWFLKKNGSKILSFSLLLALAAALVAWKLPPRFEASQTIFVGRQPQSQSANFYGYDGYYSQQSAEKFADTVVGFLRNKDLVNRALSQSGLINQSAEPFRIKRLSPQLINLAFVHGEREKARAAVDYLSRLVMEVSQTLNVQGDSYLRLSWLEPSPLVEEKRFSPWTSFVAALLASVPVTTLVLAIFESWRRFSGRI